MDLAEGVWREGEGVRPSNGGENLVFFVALNFRFSSKVERKYTDRETLGKGGGDFFLMYPNLLSIGQALQLVDVIYFYTFLALDSLILGRFNLDLSAC
jgi:hypothetical protein